MIKCFSRESLSLLSGMILVLGGGLFTVVVAAETSQLVLPVDSLYQAHCSVCHGESGDAQSKARYGLDPAPRDFTRVDLAQELSRERMIASVTHGREGTAMMAWEGRLSATQIASLVDYIRTTFMPEIQLSVDDTPSAVVVKTAQPEGESYRDHGKRLYVENCRVCHGDRGNGSTWTTTVLSPSPRNFTSPQSRRILTRKRMLASVQYGRKDTAMVSFSERFSPDDMAAVVDYVRDEFMTGAVVADAGMADLSSSDATRHTGGGHGGARAPSSIGSHGMTPKSPRFGASAAVDMAAAFPGGLTGDFEKGRFFYMNNCSACHGVRGDGLGPRASFIRPKPRNFIHADSRSSLNRPALFKAIVIGKPGTPMAAWGKVLDPQAVADVAEFVFQDFIHPDPNLNRDKGGDWAEEVKEAAVKKKLN